MIDTGVCFCHNCGSLFKEAYYKTGSHPVGIKLFHSRSRLRRKHLWETRPFRADGKEIALVDVPRFERTIGGEDGIPDSVIVTFEDDTEEELMRCCPMCKGVDTQLPIDSGRYPTYVIAVVGGRSVGKSTWLETIALGSSLEAVNKNHAYPNQLDVYRKRSNAEEAAATNVGSVGKTNYLRILDSEGKIVASVILLDAAGELYRTISEPGNPLRKFLLGNGDYAGVDGLIYMEPAMAQFAEIRSKEDQENAQNVFQVYSEMETVGALRGKPVAFVCTQTDKMLEQKSKIPKIWDMSGEEEVPICTEATFRGPTSYAPRDLARRIPLEDSIARRLNSDVLNSREANRCGFMIQSCADRRRADGVIQPDRNKNFNVMDPLLWMLNKLGIFPIPQE